jgi:RecB family exonuclease
VQVRPGFDPRDDATQTVSATQLQVLGSCPLQYLQRYVLRVREPDDPAAAPDQWLSPLARGTLMHAIFERTLAAARAEDVEIATDEFEVRALAIADQELENERELQSPPGEAIFEVEREGVHEDTRAFVAMVREDGDRFIALEQRFGRDGHGAVPVRLPDGRTLNLGGAIDRVDRLADGRLVVIDYKTGSRARFAGRKDPFDGGRRLQHALYAAVAETLHGAEVARAEYHFPTRRSENHRARFARQDLRDGLAVVSDLLELAAQGTFVPTTDPDDCRICAYAVACRVRAGSYGHVDSPPVRWAREATADALEVLRGLRR